MKKSIAFIVFGLMLVPFFVLAQEYDYNSQTGQGNMNNQSNTGTANIGNTPTTGTAPAGNQSGTGQSTIINPSVPLQNSGGTLTSPPPGGTLTSPPPGRQTAPPAQPSAKLENPLGSKANSLTGLFIKLVNVVVNISYGVVAFFLILSGFKFVVAQGKPQEIESAKKTFWYTIVGGLIIVGAQTIARILENLVKSL